MYYKFIIYNTYILLFYNPIYCINYTIYYSCNIHYYFVFVFVRLSNQFYFIYNCYL